MCCFDELVVDCGLWIVNIGVDDCVGVSHGVCGVALGDDPMEYVEKHAVMLPEGLKCVFP